jgi:hypothetical protein
MWKKFKKKKVSKIELHSLIKIGKGTYRIHRFDIDMSGEVIIVGHRIDNRFDKE